MYKSIKTMENFGQTYFVKAEIDKLSYTSTDKNGDEEINKSEEVTEKLRVKEQMVIELRNFNHHQMMGSTLCNTIWGQSDDGVRAKFKMHKDFKKAYHDNHIID